MSAGGLAGLALLLFVCSLFIALLSPVVDQLNHSNNLFLSQTTLPISQERMDTMVLLIAGFRVMAFIIMLAAGLNYWVNSIREAAQQEV